MFFSTEFGGFSYSSTVKPVIYDVPKLANFPTFSESDTQGSSMVCMHYDPTSVTAINGWSSTGCLINTESEGKVTC